jgi:hypothetical protein
MKYKITIATGMLALLCINPSWGQGIELNDAWILAGASTTIKPKNPPNKTPSQFSPKTNDTLAPLQGPMTIKKSNSIKSSIFKDMDKPITLKKRDKLDQAYGIFRATTTQYTDAVVAVKLKWNACKAKSYSINDQHIAGCYGIDTILQCQEKLVQWCSKQAYINLYSKRQRLETEIKAFTRAWREFCAGNMDLMSNRMPPCHKL